MIPRISKKKLASLGGKLPWSTISSAPKKRPNRVNRKRKQSEFARCYGSKERVEFVKSLPCAACGVVGYSENAHVLGNGGMSRKAGYKTIASLCRSYIDGPSCHTMYDEERSEFDACFPDFDAEKAAAETQKLWLTNGDPEK